MNDKLMVLFACYMLELLIAKKVIDTPKNEQMCRDMIDMVIRDFQEYVRSQGFTLTKEAIPEPPRAATTTPMSRGSKLIN